MNPKTKKRADFAFVEVLDAESCWTIQHVLHNFEVKPGLKVQIILEDWAMKHTGQWRIGIMHKLAGGAKNLATMSEEIQEQEYDHFFECIGLQTVFWVLCELCF